MTDAPTPPGSPADPPPGTPGAEPSPYPTPPPPAHPSYPSAPGEEPPSVYGPPMSGPPASGPPAYGAAPEYGAPSGDAYAHWGLRVGAALLDGLLLVPFYLLVIIGTAIASAGVDKTYDSMGYEHDHATGTTGAGLALVVLAYIALIAFAIWNQVVRQGRTGWSLGKKWVGIRLIDEHTGRPMGALMCFVRSLCHFVDEITFFLGYLWPLWDHKRQTFADKIMHTVVIQQKQTP